MITHGEDQSIATVNRALEVVSRQLHKLFKGRVEIAELRSLGGPAVADVLRRWDGRGSLEGFAMQRLRWAILRELRRQRRRDARAGFRHDLCALVAIEDATDDLPAANGARDAADAASAQPASLKDLLRRGAIGLTLEIAAGDPDEQADTARDVDHADDRIDVRRAAERLPGPLREMIDRRYFRGETIEEMAAGLSMKGSTVFDHLNRALDRLREELCPPAGGAVVPLRRK